MESPRTDRCAAASGSGLKLGVRSCWSGFDSATDAAAGDGDLLDFLSPFSLSLSSFNGV